MTLHRFGRNLRLVLLFAWLTLLPDWTPLPVNSQLRDMMHLFFLFLGQYAAGAVPGRVPSGLVGKLRFYSHTAPARQANPVEALEFCCKAL